MPAIEKGQKADCSLVLSRLSKHLTAKSLASEIGLRCYQHVMIKAYSLTLITQCPAISCWNKKHVFFIHPPTAISFLASKKKYIYNLQPAAIA